MRHLSIRWALSFVVATLLCACATRYVDKPIEKELASDSFGDVVVFQSSEDFRKSPPLCIGVMPFEATKAEYLPTEDLRKAIHAHLAPSGILLIPLQKIDSYYRPSSGEVQNLQVVAKGTSCDTLLSGEVTERASRFWGVYSEVRIGASLRITKVSTGQVIWRARHTAVVRDGGIPLNPLSLISGVVNAGMNLRDEQLTRTTHDLARRLVAAISLLQFTNPEIEFAQTVRMPPKGKLSVHAFIASLQEHTNPAIDVELAASLEGEMWTDPGDRAALAEFWLKKSPKNTRAMEEGARAKLKLGEPEAALRYSKQALELDPKNPEILFLKGRAHLQLADPAQAAQSILAAAVLDSQNSSYFLALGLAYNQMGTYDRAVAALTKYIGLEPNRAFAQMQIGIAYVGIGDDAEAAKALRRALVLSVANDDYRSASKAIGLIKSMNLESLLSAEDLIAMENRVREIQKRDF